MTDRLIGFMLPPFRLRADQGMPGMLIAAGVALGFVVGYIVHYLLVKDANPGLSSLAGIISAILGGVVTDVVKGDLFTGYCIGLAIGFIAYWIALKAGADRAATRRASGLGMSLFPWTG